MFDFGGIDIRRHLWAKLLFALVLGLGAGYGLIAFAGDPGPSWVTSAVEWLSFPGSIFLAAIQLVVVPLILSSIILALASVGKGASAKIWGTTALIFVLVSTSVAALIGIMVTDYFKPGNLIQGAIQGRDVLENVEAHSIKVTPESLLQYIPTNLLASLLKGDLLEVLLISLIFGFVMGQMPARHARPLQEFLVGIQSVCLKLISIVMVIAPFAVFGLMVRAVVQSGFNVVLGMTGYLMCTFVGFAIMGVLYCLWIHFFVGMSAFRFLKSSSDALILAFSLSSSAATMPTTLRVAREKLSIGNDVAQFFIPLGTTVNMAGSAIWQTTATVFILQAYGGEFHFSSVLLVVVLTVGASIGTPGVPGAGLGVLSSTLKAVGVPSSGIPLILGVDRLVDMGCTVINVMGDLVLCLTAQKKT